MTIGDMISKMGLGNKFNDRYAEYSAPSHESHVFYGGGYEHSIPTHVVKASSKHHYGGGGHKSNAAMSALTLLSFLFFLNILQQCLRDHMQQMTASTPQVMVLTAREEVSKTSNTNKLDKTGVSESASEDVLETIDVSPITEAYDDADDRFMKIKTAEYSPNAEKHNHRTFKKNYGNITLV